MLSEPGGDLALVPCVMPDKAVRSTVHTSTLTPSAAGYRKLAISVLPKALISILLRGYQIAVVNRTKARHWLRRYQNWSGQSPHRRLAPEPKTLPDW